MNRKEAGADTQALHRLSPQIRRWRHLRSIHVLPGEGEKAGVGAHCAVFSCAPTASIGVTRVFEPQDWIARSAPFGRPYLRRTPARWRRISPPRCSSAEVGTVLSRSLLARLRVLVYMYTMFKKHYNNNNLATGHIGNCASIYCSWQELS